MKSNSALGKTNAFVVVFDYNILPPPLMQSLAIDGFCLKCSSIEHINVYLSVLAFLI